MSKWARRRDACEKAIIVALKAAGCSVQQLDGKGVPDLLVAWSGDEMRTRVGIGEYEPDEQYSVAVQRMVLIECKDPDDGARNSRSTGKKVANPLGLRDSQWDWWKRWTGPRPVVVTTPQEALDAVFPERVERRRTA